jgi:hypothetical protein
MRCGEITSDPSSPYSPDIMVSGIRQIGSDQFAAM